jgi:hypothetical protein
MPCDFSVFEGVSRAREAFGIVRVDDDSVEEDELRATAFIRGF